MDKKPQWRFREMQPGEINIDPIEGEFFTTEALGSLNDALVRESIQNSLDAKIGSGPVTVRFSFHNRLNFSSGSKEIAAACFDGIGPHLNARHSGLQGVLSLSQDFEYILIEDYGTRGLQGDILQYDDLDDEVKRNDFYYFWRNIGRTRKSDTDLGRWGLGKTVFQAASRINSFFGLTVRNDDRRTMLMGQSVLKIHKVSGRRYAPYGFFGLFDNDLPLPVEDPEYIASFAKQLKMDRLEKSGFSILVPYPDKELMDPKECLKSVIKHYFFPLLAGELIIEIKQGNKAFKLDAVRFDTLLKNKGWLEKQGLLGLIELGRWAIRQPSETFIRLDEPVVGKAPKLRAELFAPEMLAAAQTAFAEKNRLAFHVPISIQKFGSQEVMHTGFSVFLERDEKLEKAEDHFIRQGITIPEVTSLKHKGIRAIVSITERDLSAFLGDAENPAHTEWERNSKKFKQKYRLGVSTLDFVKSSPRELVKILTLPKKGRDENLLKHLFSLPAEATPKAGSDGKNMENGTGESKEGNGNFVGIEGSGYLQLAPIKGGFRLKRKTQATKVPKHIMVRMAYEVRSGNPFPKYSPLDFDVSQKPIQIKLEGGKLLFYKENAIQIEVLADNFSLTLSGFDPNRDLRVKTIP